MAADLSMQLCPVEVLGVHKTIEKEDNLEVLIGWSEGTLESATWEQATLIQEQFPEFHLEDKVALWGTSNDTRVKVYSRRDKNRKKKE